MAINSKTFAPKRLACLASLPLALVMYTIRTIPASAQTCDPSMMSCADTDVFSTPASGGDVDTGIFSTPTFAGDVGVDSSTSASDTGVSSSTQPQQPATHDQCVAKADQKLEDCEDSIPGSTVGGAVVGCLTGLLAGGVGCIPGAAVGAATAGAGSSTQCLVNYAVDRAKCD